MMLFILILSVFGFLILNMLEKKKKLSHVITFSLILGVGINSLIFFLLGCLGIYYSKDLFLTITAIFLIINLLVKKLRNNLLNIENDVRHVPIYYIAFALYILYRFITLTSTSYVNFYNWDEMRVYQYISKSIFITHDTGIMHSVFAPMNYFLGTMSYEFAGLSLSSPRIFGGIFYVIMSMIVYFGLRDSKVNNHIAALFSMLLLVSSGENLIYYKSFYNNVFYAVYVLPAIYLFSKHYFIDNKKNLPILSLILFSFSLLVRREASYHLIIFFAIMTPILYFYKKINKKESIFLGSSSVLFMGVVYLLEKIVNISNSSVFISDSTSVIQNFQTNFQPSVIKSFVSSAFSQMFEIDMFTSNGLFFIVFLIFLIICVIEILSSIKNKKITEKSKNYLTICLFIMIYLGIVLGTSFILFDNYECLAAASFTRYMMMVIPVSYIAVGQYLFHDTEEERIGQRKEISMPKNPRVLMIIPAYNEEENILRTYKTIQDYNKKNKTNYEVIVINDGSSDDTGKICAENHIPTINLINNLGIGGAVQTGYKYAFENGYDIAIQYDGDGQHDVSYVKKIIKPLINKEADIVIGSRFVEELSEFKSTRLRRVGINVISFLIKLVTGVTVKDPTSGFRAANRNVLEHLSRTYPREFPEPESIVTLIKRGYLVKEVPVEMKERIGGVSSIRMWKTVYYMINVCLSIIITSVKKVGDC